MSELDKNDVRKHFGEVLKQLRQHKGLSQQELAEAASTQPHYISMIETGKRQPTITKVFELATGLDMSAAELMGYVEASLNGKLETGPRIKP